MAAEQLSYPQWTEYRKKSGLDPLGMQNSSINLYQRLLPGISNLEALKRRQAAQEGHRFQVHAPRFRPEMCGARH